MKQIRPTLFPLGILAAVFALAACGSLSPSAVATPQAAGVAAVPTTSTDKQTMELISYWGGGAELDALNALINVYRKRYPNLDLIHLNSGPLGGGGITDEYLLGRLRKEQPPDSLVIHAGKESLEYINRGELEPITRLFQEEGFDQVMPPLLLEQITIKGEIYTVPVNIQRSNILWFNSKVFRANGLQPPHTLDEFFVVAEQLKSKDIIPLALGGGFELGHLFESVLVAVYGPEDYVRLMNGDPALWADARLTTAIHTFERMLEYSNADRESENWFSAAQRVLDGKAAMTVMGDWTEGMYKAFGAKPNVDFGWVPAPGTEGTFIWLSDSFGLPVGAPHREAAIEFLKTVGSKEGQDAFNPLKGSIPARTDADKRLYDEYLRWSFDQFRAGKLVPSIAHGAAAPDSFRSAYSRALIDFSLDLDESKLWDALRAAVIELEQ